MKEFSIFRIDNYLAILDNRTLEIIFGHCSQQYDLIKKAKQFRSNQYKPSIIERKPSNLFNEQVACGTQYGNALEHTLRGPANYFVASILYLIITEKCNLNCGYCFIEKDLSRKHKRHMSFEVAKRAISTFANLVSANRSYKGKPVIVFYGGEPLLNWPTIRKVLAYIDKAFPGEFRLILNTNGVLLTDEIAAAIKSHSISVSLSIDGRREINDSMRLDAQGNGTYMIVRHRYELLNRRSVDTGLSITINTHNINSLESEVEWLLTEFGPKSVSLNLPHTPATVSQESPPARTVAEKVLEVFDIAREKGIFEERTMRRLVPFVNRKFYFRDCGAVGSQLVVRADGKCGPCHALIHDDNVFLVDIFDTNIEERLFTSEIFKEWAGRYPVNMPECSNCDAICICGGGCPYEAMVKKGTIWSIDERNCVLAKMLMDKIMEELFKSSGISSL